MTKDFFVPDIYRTFSVGFDEIVKNLEHATRNASKFGFGYPPYNIVKQDDNKYCIELAVAGFGKQDIEIELKENSLVISGKINNDNSSDPQYLYKGIADRAFVRQFNLADTIEIKNTQLVNGMLKIFLENIIPESKKPRKIEIKDNQ